MKSRAVVRAICLLALAAMMVSSAEAGKRKEIIRPAAPPGWDGTPACHEPERFHCGPLYNSNVYLGTDPDPFIRSMIQRDLGAKYGPSE